MPREREGLQLREVTAIFTKVVLSTTETTTTNAMNFPDTAERLMSAAGAMR